MADVSRRRFLAGSAVAAGLSLSGSWPVFADERPMPRRAFGRTGVDVSLAGFGGVQVGRGGLSDEEGVALVHRAMELGIDYFDVAPSYNGGRSERRIGLALERDQRREKVFLATKTLRRDKKGAERELAASLKRLRTDRLDLWQFHALSSTRDTGSILDEKRGALAAGLAAQKAGRVRFLGITGHADPDVFVDALKRYPFDALLVPVNCIDPWHRSFEKTALPFANGKKTAVVAMKVFCSGRLPKRRIVGAEDCLRYTYGSAINTCIVGCSSVEEVELAAHVARNLKELTDKERDALRARTKKHSPGLEWYKRKD